MVRVKVPEILEQLNIASTLSVCAGQVVVTGSLRSWSSCKNEIVCRLKSLQWGEDVSQERIRERGLDDDGQEDAATSKRLCCRVGPRGSYIYVQLRLLPVPACKVQTMYFLSGDYRSTRCTAVGGMHCYHALRRPCISQNPILQLDPELAPRISGDPADP